jgi:hypothetical protein
MLQKKAEDWKKDELQEDGEVYERREGTARYLARMLEMKFGPLDEASHALLDAADYEKLIAWTDRMLDARAIQDVFAEPAAEPAGE